jgi:predicted aspartyl protease
MTKYNTSYDPPAPIAKIALKNIESSERLPDIEMVLDTGSDITILPKSAIDKLRVKPAGINKYRLVGFDGNIVESEIYCLQVSFLGKRFTGNYCAIEDSKGILGRDLLNEISILFDGPNLEWDEIQSSHQK